VWSSELDSTAGLPSPFVAETQGQDKVPPVGIGPRWYWTSESQVLPWLAFQVTNFCPELH